MDSRPIAAEPGAVVCIETRAYEHAIGTTGEGRGRGGSAHDQDGRASTRWRLEGPSGMNEMGMRFILARGFGRRRTALGAARVSQEKGGAREGSARRQLDRSGRISIG